MIQSTVTRSHGRSWSISNPVLAINGSFAPILSLLVCLLAIVPTAQAQVAFGISQFRTFDSEHNLGIAYDQSGNIYVTGSWEGLFVTMGGPTDLPYHGDMVRDVYVAKYDANGVYQWAFSIGGNSLDHGNAIDVDGSGNVYITGVFGGTVDFDPGTGTQTLSSSGASDAFLAKYDTAGAYQWALNLGGSSDDEGRGIDIDGGGNVFATGWFKGTADFDPGVGISNLVSAGGGDAFVAKFDTDGAYVWAINLGGTTYDYGEDLAVSSTGGVYVTGRFSGNVDFDPGSGVENQTSTGPYDYDAFVAKYDATGAYVWAFGVGTGGYDLGRGIAVDAAGSAYVTGSFVGTADFDPGTASQSLTSRGTTSKPDAFVAKYTTSGTYEWAFPLGGDYDDEGWGIALDASGYLYVSGNFFYGPTDFDPGPGVQSLQDCCGGDVYVAKYTTGGAYAGAFSLGGNGREFGRGVAADPAGNVYLTGTLASRDVDFDPGAGLHKLSQPSGGYEGVFVGKYSGTTHFVVPNTAPTLAQNSGLTVDEGATATIANTSLQVTDAEQGAAALTYTVGTAPVSGSLKKSGSALASGGTFTQDDIDQSLINYAHDGSETTSDSFTFTASDGAGGTIASTTFTITVTPVFDTQSIKLQASLTQSGTTYTGQTITASLNASGTNGYDAALDTPAAPAPPNNFVRSYFTNSGLTSSGFSQFQGDVRGEADLTAVSQDWNLTVENGSSQSGQTVTLTFTLAGLPAAFPVMLIDNADGSFHNVRTMASGAFMYTASTTARSFTLRYGDSTPPNLSVTHPGSALRGDSHTLEWASTSTDLERFEVEISTDAGATYGGSAAISSAAARSHTFSVPAGLFFYRIRVRVSAFDTSDNRTQVETSNLAVTPTSVSKTYSPGWSFVSLPLGPTDNSLTGIFGAASPPYFVYTFNGLAFGPAATLSSGQGAWLAVTTSNRTVNLGGIGVTTDHTVALNEGFTMVGNPLGETFAKGQLYLTDGTTEKTFAEAVTAGWISSSVFGYSGSGYSDEANVAPWGGYWLATLRSGLSLRVKPAEIAVYVAPPTKHDGVEGVQSPQEWTLPLAARTGSAEDVITSLGVHPDATNGFDGAFDAPEPPAPPLAQYVQAYFSRPEWSLPTGSQVNTDVALALKPGESHEWPLDVVARGLAGEELTLSWPYPGVEDHRFELFDGQTGSAIG